MRSQPKSKFVADIITTAKVIWLTSWILSASAWAGEWPCWRGPRGDGVSGEGPLLCVEPCEIGANAMVLKVHQSTLVSHRDRR